ncbi:MAG: hypothetical protein JW951_02870 [Lentisphaerae bacterium]|nr:hypothetical protein [Lentisphaerota bacterium]
MRRWRAGIWAAAALLSAGAARGATPAWWDAAWPYRVRLDSPAGQGDVAWARVALADRTRRDGRDLRLLDNGGRPRPFRIEHHDPFLSTLLSLQVAAGRAETLWLYYGNTNAPAIEPADPFRGEREAARARWDRLRTERETALERRAALQRELEGVRKRLADAGGTNAAAAGVRRELEAEAAALEAQHRAVSVEALPPEPSIPGPWTPRRGILLTVYRKAEPGHPPDIAALRALIERSELEGAMYRTDIADGYNRFGPSEQYISVYEGYLQVPAAGVYAFCSASDDGSWVYVNDEQLVAWPGAHGWGAGLRGEHSGEIRLEQGMARVRYYHEQGENNQMAFLGWRAPGEEKFWSIPREHWLSVREAKPGPHEARHGGTVPVPRAEVESTYWIRDSQDEQATLVRFRDASRSGAGAIVHRRWTFGDGLESADADVRHAYFRLGRPEVTLEVADAAGNRGRARCRPRLFKVDVRAHFFNYGNENQYIEATAGYDVEKLRRDDLALYADFLACLEQWQALVEAADALIRRFPDYDRSPAMGLQAAEACLTPKHFDPARAVRFLDWVAAQAPPDLRRRADLRKAEVQIWHLDAPDAGRERIASVLAEAAGESDASSRALERRCRIGLGDAALVQGRLEAADAEYRRAAGLSERNIDEAERLAKRGTYPHIVNDLLARGEEEWALKTIDEWETEFPQQKLEGTSLFLRGKVLYILHPGPQALRFLRAAVEAAPGAVHVPEAVWLRANCLMDLERYREALEAFARITTDFTETRYAAAAVEKAEACRAALADANPGAGGE